ncbi:MAG: response regulator [Desulfomonile tiedjei]|nr:response regulator [Desulfomonile tiedjei]
MKGRILLVDDNADFLDSTKDVLEDEGYEVITATSGEEAVRKGTSECFHVIVMDIKMPGINGVEAFIKIKKKKPAVKVIMCTAYIVESLIREALALGAHAVLNKPFEMGLLIRTIDNALLQSKIESIILVADRDRKLCAMLRRVLTAHGHHVVVAHDGPAALEEAQRHAFNILLLESNLPGLTGLEVHHKVKARQPELLATIIMGPDSQMDEGGTPALPREVRLTGLSKPLDIPQLVELLDGICAAERV